MIDKGYNSFITGDETWLYYYDVPTVSKQSLGLWGWGHTDSCKNSRSQKKKMTAVFFKSSGIFVRIVLDDHAFMNN